ncbi:MAG: SH3 domain-containing protein [Microgenomates group bacterium]
MKLSFNKKWLLFFGLILILLLGFLVFKKIFSTPKLAVISISSSPQTAVFIDNVQVGTASLEKPYYNDKIEPGEHRIKLVPESNELIPWEGKINLPAGILTSIKRELASSEAESGGQVVWLEKIENKRKASLAVISFPEQAVVKLGGEPKGFTPFLNEEIPPGSYQIEIAAPGYKSRTISIKLIAGYKLLINAKLAKEIEGIEEMASKKEAEEATSSGKPMPSPTPLVKSNSTTSLKKPYVEIKNTPTGWLRIRSKPSTSGEELGKAKPGETFPYLGETVNGWYKIEYEEDKEGWVSGTYADLIE